MLRIVVKVLIKIFRIEVWSKLILSNSSASNWDTVGAVVKPATFGSVPLQFSDTGHMVSFRTSVGFFLISRIRNVHWLCARGHFQALEEHRMTIAVTGPFKEREQRRGTNTAIPESEDHEG